ncbi:MAG: hypothetical protein IIW10_06620 [Spirochaetaceae bacterium]|nr:hypothetical protein [Spirochaetaceae bacterium]
MLKARYFVYVARLMQRVTYFFALYSLVIFAIHAVGTGHNFLPSSQILLLKILSATSVALFLLAIFLTIRSVLIIIFHHRWKRRLRFCMNIFLIILGIILFLYSAAVIHLHGPIKM